MKPHRIAAGGVILKAEGITEAGWFEKCQLEDEITYPPCIVQYDRDDFRSGSGGAQCLPSRVANL